jgi:CHAD domain-containing protein
MAYRFGVATANPSQWNPAVLSIRLLALLEKVSARAGAEEVHRLRTTVRRLEVQLGSPPARIAKSLKILRRKAGKVRDIDVHLGLLKPPLLSPPPAHRRKVAASPDAGPQLTPQPRPQPQDKLRQILKDKRDRQFGALRALVAEAAPLLESRLPAFVERCPQATVSLRDARQQAGRARQRFLQWTRDIPGDEQGLHELRIRTKKLRYSLEPLEACEEAAGVVAKLKQVQDAIGRWHDWQTLEQLAARYLDSSDAAPARDALHARCACEYRRARRTAQSVRSWMSQASATGGPGASGRSGIGGRVPAAKPSVGGATPAAAGTDAPPRLIRKAG